jgi:hypothetical protein
MKPFRFENSASDADHDRDADDVARVRPLRGSCDVDFNEPDRVPPGSRSDHQNPWMVLGAVT